MAGPYRLMGCSMGGCTRPSPRTPGVLLIGPACLGASPLPPQVRHTSHMFLTGPDVVRRVTGEAVTQVGGYRGPWGWRGGVLQAYCSSRGGTAGDPRTRAWYCRRRWAARPRTARAAASPTAPLTTTWRRWRRRGSCCHTCRCPTESARRRSAPPLANRGGEQQGAAPRKHTCQHACLLTSPLPTRWPADPRGGSVPGGSSRELLESTARPGLSISRRLPGLSTDLCSALPSLLPPAAGRVHRPCGTRLPLPGLRHPRLRGRGEHATNEGRGQAFGAGHSELPAVAR